MSDPRICFIAGPTASGKSTVAIEVAERVNAEIVSADAYQIYQGMPVLTAMPSAEQRRRVPHHMIDFLPVSENWDASSHYHRAMQCIADIHKRGKHVIVVGGSGLYFKFLSHGLSQAPTDHSLRAMLAERTLDDLVHELQRRDPEGAAATNLQNRRYVERNLEIVIAGQKPLSHWKSNWNSGALGLGWVLNSPVEKTDTRIHARTQQMFTQGVLEEVSALPPCSVTADKTLGLREIRKHLAGELSLDACMERLFIVTRQYAKRQRTWLKHELWLDNLNIDDFSSLSTLSHHISNVLLKSPQAT